MIELGHTPTSYEVANLVGALRYRMDAEEGPVSFGLEREPVADSLLSLAGASDPVTGRDWGGVISNRAYLEGSFGDEDFNIYGGFSGAMIDGQAGRGKPQWQGASRILAARRIRTGMAGAVRRQSDSDGLCRQSVALHDRPRRIFQPAPVPVRRAGIRCHRAR